MFQIRTMITYCLVMALLASSARATEEELHLKDYEYTESDPRLFFANFTSSLVQGGQHIVVKLSSSLHFWGIYFSKLISEYYLLGPIF